MGPKKNNFAATAAVVAMIVPLIIYVLGWSVYRDPADESFHFARQTSIILPCGNGDVRIFSTKIRFGPSDEARRRRLQDLQDGREKLDCRAGAQDLAQLGL